MHHYQVRAQFTTDSVRVYQAYSDHIADAALAAGTFVSPFSLNRMTWIKPSFLWMAHRSGWAKKPGQQRVLAIDISHEGFRYALAHSCLSSFKSKVHQDHQQWKQSLRESPVRIQWDPDRSISLQPQPWRAIQIGLGPEVVPQYVHEWISKITDVTPLVHNVHKLVQTGELTKAEELVPSEKPYLLPSNITKRIGADNAAL